MQYCTRARRQGLLSLYTLTQRSRESRLQQPCIVEALACRRFYFSSHSSSSSLSTVETWDARRVPRLSSVRKKPQSSLHVLFKRTEKVAKVLEVLLKRSWDEKTEDSLIELGAPFSAFAVSEVVRKTSNLDIALRFFNWLKLRYDFKPDSYVYGILLNKLGKERRFEEMETLGIQCEEDGRATVATFTSLISAYMSVKDIEKAMRTWRRMEKFRIEPNLVTYTAMIDLYASMGMHEQAGDYYHEMLGREIFPNVSTCNVLIKHLVEAGKLDAAMTIFGDMVKVLIKPNFVTYNHVMLGFARAGNLDLVLDFVKQLHYYSYRPRSLGDSLDLVLKYLVKEGKVKDVEMVMRELWPESSLKDIRQKIVEFQAMVDGGKRIGSNFMKEGMDLGSDSGSDSELSDDASSKDCGMYLNLNVFVKCLVPWRPETGRVLERAHVKWDGQVVSGTLSRLRDATVAWKFFEWVSNQEGFNHDSYTYHRMIQILLGVGDFELVLELLEEALQKEVPLSIHTYNTVLKYCGLKKADKVALEVFDLLEKGGLEPEERTYERLIQTLCICGSHKRAATLLLKMVKAGFSPSEQTFSFLICGFVKDGDLKLAKATFGRMRAADLKPNVHIYKAYLSFYSQKGKLDKAEKVFRNMKKDGIALDKQVYDWMIEAYKNTGRQEEASKFQDEMKALISTSMLSRERKQDIFMSFHSLFVENLTNTGESQSAIAA